MVYRAGGSIFDQKFPRLLLSHDWVPQDQRNQVHATSAAFTAFEQEVFAAGKHPQRGFYGEVLHREHTGQALLQDAIVIGCTGDFKARMEEQSLPW